MSRRPSRPKRDPLASFFRSVYDSLAKKVLEEEAASADGGPAVRAKPAAERPASGKPDVSQKPVETNEKTIH